MSLFSKIFGNKRIKELENEVRLLKEKLDERQEVINQTNAYWKKKMHAVQSKNKKKKETE